MGRLNSAGPIARKLMSIVCSLLLAVMFTPLMLLVSAAYGDTGSIIIRVGNYDDELVVAGKSNYDYANQVLSIVNQERASAGLSSLTMDADLCEAAMQRAAECAVNYSHTRPNGQICFTVASKAYAENIACGYGSPASVMKGWMNSSGHKANILKSGYKSIGVGSFTNNGYIYWVQLFGYSGGQGSVPSSAEQKTYTVQISTSQTPIHAELGLGTSHEEDVEQLETGDSVGLAFYVRNDGWVNAYTAIDASTFTWTSSDESVCTVTSQGMVVAGSKTGTAIVTATSKYGFASCSQTFEVIEKAIRLESVDAISNQSYTGNAIEPAVVVRAGGEVLAKGADYTVEYSDNVDVGVATVVVTGTGKYTGSITANFTIVAAQIADASVEKDEYVDDGWGWGCEPDVTVWNSNGDILEEDVDYEVSYSDNASAGIATVTIEGIDNYTGKLIRTFKILPAKPFIMMLAGGKHSFSVYAGYDGGITGYQVSYKLAGGTWATKTCKGKTISKKISKLKSGKKYSVRVRTYKKVNGVKLYSAWSKTRKAEVR